MSVQWIYEKALTEGRVNELFCVTVASKYLQKCSLQCENEYSPWEVY